MLQRLLHCTAILKLETSVIKFIGPCAEYRLSFDRFRNILRKVITDRDHRQNIYKRCKRFYNSYLHQR